MSKEQKILLLLIILVGGAGAGFYVSNAKKSEAEVVAVTTPTPITVPVQTTPDLVVSTPTKVTPPVAVATTYSQDVTYSTPEEGHETIHVKLSLKDGAIADVSFSYDTPKKRESRANLGSFEKALAAQGLVGKKLSDVSLSRVGGASLTTAAFNQALGQIAAKA